MDFTFPKNVCDRRRYYTGNDKPISANNANLYLEVGDKQLMGGRVYLCTFYAYVRAASADLWVMLFDAGNNVGIQDLPNPQVVMWVPAGFPTTAGYEPSGAEIDEVSLPCGTKVKVGTFFEHGVRMIVSSTELTLTPVNDWGYVTKADFVTAQRSVGGVA